MRLKRLVTDTDLAPGLAAVAVLAAAVFWLPAPWGAPLGLLAAVLVYGGLRLLLVRRPDAEAATKRQARQEAVRRARSEVDEVRRLGARLPQDEPRAQVKGIVATMDAILAVIEEDEKDARLARYFTDRYVAPARQLLEEYLPLAARDVASSRAQRATVEQQDLPLLAAALADLFEQVHRANVTDLEIASEMLRFAIGGTGAPAAEAAPAATEPVNLPARQAPPPEPALAPLPERAAVPVTPVNRDGLTDREIEVLRRIAAGRSNREIADELSLSVRTVERHITNLYGKINARGRADATAYALFRGFITREELPDLVLDVTAARSSDSNRWEARG
jgi:DNA-binding CsgD family transcriptional regulator